jgi:hypothetical protein
VHRTLVGAAIAVSIAIPATVAAANPSQDVARARGEFNQGQYRAVIELLVPQLYPKPRIGDKDELKEARYLLAEAYFFSNQLEKAEEQFTALLFLDPTTSLDPVLEDPAVYGFFESIRSKKKAELEELLRLQREAEAAAAAPKFQIVVDRTVISRSAGTNLIPLGAGVFANGNRTRGWIYLVSQSVFATTWALAFGAQALQYGIPSKVPRDEADTVRLMQGVQIFSGSLFVLLYAASVIDAYANQTPRIIETRREVPIEKPKKTSLVVPLLTPDAVGVGVTWEF